MKYTCTYCGKVKRNLKNFENHIRSHAEISPYKADQLIVALRKEKNKLVNKNNKKKNANVFEEINDIPIQKNKIEKYKNRITEILKITPNPEKHISKVNSLKSIGEIQNYIETKLNIDYKILFESKGLKFNPQKKEEEIEYEPEKTKTAKKPWWILYTPMGNKR